MKTIIQIKQLLESIAVGGYDSRNNELELIESVRDNFLPLFQFNFDASSLEIAQNIFAKIAENVQRKSYVTYLPDGQHTIDKLGTKPLKHLPLRNGWGVKLGRTL